jgi:hypothetical protein
MNKKAGRPENDFETKRVSVPSTLVPEVKKLIEQWKLERGNAKSNNDNNNLQEPNKQHG